MRVLLSLLLCSGCSLLVVRGPSPDRPGRCTVNATGPVVADVFGTIAAGATSIALMANVNNSDGNGAGYVAGGVAMAAATALFVTSIVVGSHRAEDCRGSIW